MSDTTPSSLGGGIGCVRSSRDSGLEYGTTR